MVEYTAKDFKDNLDICLTKLIKVIKKVIIHNLMNDSHYKTKDSTFINLEFIAKELFIIINKQRINQMLVFIIVSKYMFNQILVIIIMLGVLFFV